MLRSDHISARTKTVIIQTPEGIDFSFRLAGPITRMLAWLVDIFCIMVLNKIILMGVELLAVISADFSNAFQIFGFFVTQVGYGITLEWLWRGQTLGKRLLRLRVMDEQGLRLHFSQVFIRNLMRFIDSLPALYLVGGIACIISRRSQRIGDFAANTIVILNVPLEQPDIEQIAAGKFNSLRMYPHIEARLRQRTSPREAGLALKALMRRDNLEAGARIELFEEMAAHFHSVVEFPQDAIEGITDEQFVRNVVDVLFRQRAS